MIHKPGRTAAVEWQWIIPASPHLSHGYLIKKEMFQRCGREQQISTYHHWATVRYALDGRGVCDNGTIVDNEGR